MDRTRKAELVERSLGIRHKLKVQESMPHPKTHEELAVHLLVKWDLEDELRAIEEILTEDRAKHVTSIRNLITKEGTPLTKRTKKKG